jgi:glutathione S-transferase
MLAARFHRRETTMDDLPLLVIGNCNYSSWSLRAWFALRHLDFRFREERLALDTPEFPAQIRRYSAAARVPVLLDGGVEIWDSLSICAWAVERTGRWAWPEAVDARAHARSAVAEMHSGFAALRAELPMNVRARGRRVVLSAAAAADVERTIGLWCEARTRFAGDGPWLYGSWSLADAFFVPVALRFRTYGIAVPELCWPWLEQLFADPHLAEWCARSEAEPEILPHEEVGT